MPLTPPASLPRLTMARAPLTCEIDAVNEYGEQHKISIPAERALTVYVDKRELVTLMTLGAHPELLVLGFLRNQRLLKDVTEIESITVDWEVGAAAVKTRHGIEDIEKKTARRVVTTGCGQGSVFGGLMDEVDQIVLPPAAGITQSQLYSLVNTIRLKETTYKSAGSVHACALFDASLPEPEMLLFVEDVGRHNAMDTIAGWMWINMPPTLVASRTALPPEEALRLRSGEAGAAAPVGEDATSSLVASSTDLGLEGLVFYTTGRMTSEMVIKSAQMGVPVVVSRSGITQMGHQVAQTVGLCAIGRATNKRFVCYSQTQRLTLQPGLVVKLEGAPDAVRQRVPLALG
ncbi:MAG: formate dehydrogenase accessory sulfurtransferase FdhD [Polaromonas sp.]|nr:formate dehydrogenase accessory sulfurtransferase FdhD [Polaromonas sp.]